MKDAKSKGRVHKKEKRSEMKGREKKLWDEETDEGETKIQRSR